MSTANLQEQKDQLQELLDLYKQTMDAALDQFDKLDRAPEPMAQYCADIAAYFVERTAGNAMVCQASRDLVTSWGPQGPDPKLVGGAAPLHAFHQAVQTEILAGLDARLAARTARVGVLADELRAPGVDINDRASAPSLEGRWPDDPQDPATPIFASLKTLYEYLCERHFDTMSDAALKAAEATPGVEVRVIHDVVSQTGEVFRTRDETVTGPQRRNEPHDGEAEQPARTRRRWWRSTQ